MTDPENASTEPDPTEHDPAEAARPSLGRRDQPDALRPDAEDRPHRTLPPDDEEAGAEAEHSPDSPRPTESRPACD